MKIIHSLKNLFLCEVDEFVKNSAKSKDFFSQNDIKALPEPVQRYFNYCGYIGKEKLNCAEIIWEKSFIKLGVKKKWMKLKTEQFNFVSGPSRLAYMKALLFGIVPFEGRDKYHDGKGHMFGVLAKLIKLFDAKEPEIAQGALVVVFAESLLVPNMALQNYIQWEEIDSLKARAYFNNGGISLSGTFSFNSKGEYIHFDTDKRYYMKNGGGYELKPYTVKVNSYQEKNGLKIAKDVCAIWHLDEGDFEYWKGTIKDIRNF